MAGSRDEELKELKAVIRSLLRPGLVAFEDLARDYFNQEGKPLNHKQFGYDTPYQFASSLNDTLEVVDDGWSFKVKPVAVNDSLHITRFVKFQNRRSKFRTKGRSAFYKQSHPPSRYSPNPNGFVSYSAPARGPLPSLETSYSAILDSIDEAEAGASDSSPALDLANAVSVPLKNECDVPVSMQPSSEPSSESLRATAPSYEPNDSTCKKREAAGTTVASDSSHPHRLNCSSPFASADNPPKREASESENNIRSQAAPSDFRQAEFTPTHTPQQISGPTVQKQSVQQPAAAPSCMFHPPSFPVPRWPIQSMPPQPPPPGLLPMPRYAGYEMPYWTHPYYASLPYPPTPPYPYWCPPLPPTHLMAPSPLDAFLGAGLLKTHNDRFINQTRPLRSCSPSTLASNVYPSTASEALAMSGREGGTKSEKTSSNEAMPMHKNYHESKSENDTASVTTHHNSKSELKAALLLPSAANHPEMKKDSVHDGDVERGSGHKDISSLAAHESMDAPEKGHLMITGPLSMPAGHSDAESKESVQSPDDKLAYVSDALQPDFEGRCGVITESQPAHSTVDEDHSGKMVRPKDEQKIREQTTQKKRDMVTSIKFILDRHPDGVSIPHFMKSFKEDYGEPLDFVKFGYPCMECFVVGNRNLFSYVKKERDSDTMILFPKAVQPSVEGHSIVSDWVPSFRYQPPVIPEQNSQVRVRIVDLVNPGLLWIQLDDTVQRLNDLMSGLNDFYSKKTENENCLPPQLVVPGLAVAVLFKATCQWHRARVESCEGDEVLVFYVDYGTTEMLKLSELWILDQQFTEDPMYAVGASLANLCPPEGTKEWPSEAYDFLIENCCQIPLLATVHSRNLDDPYNPSIEVFLYLTEKLDGQISISDILLQKRLASLKTVKPNQEVHFLELECDPSFKYKAPSVPEVFSEVQVKIVDGLNPDHFWVRLKNSEEEFTDLMCEMNVLYCLKKKEEYHLPPHLAVPGLAVAVRCKEADQWRRARIQSCEGDNIEVFYVDCGTTEIVKRNELWKLDRRLGEKPMYALRTSLANLCPPIETKGWPAEAYKFLIGNRSRTVLLASVHKKNLDDSDNPSIEVFLYSVDSSGHQECLNEALLKKNLASLKPGFSNLYDNFHPINYDVLRLLLPVWFTTSKSGDPLDLDTTVKNLRFSAEWPVSELTDLPDEHCCLRHLVQLLFSSNPIKLGELWCFAVSKFEDLILKELSSSVEPVLKEWGWRYRDLKVSCAHLMDSEKKTEEEGFVEGVNSSLCELNVSAPPFHPKEQ